MAVHYPSGAPASPLPETESQIKFIQNSNLLIFMTIYLVKPIDLPHINGEYFHCLGSMAATESYKQIASYIWHITAGQYCSPFLLA